MQALMRGKCFFSCRFVVAGGRDAGAKFIVDVIDENTEKEFNNPNSCSVGCNPPALNPNVYPVLSLAKILSPSISKDSKLRQDEQPYFF